MKNENTTPENTPDEYDHRAVSNIDEATECVVGIMAHCLKDHAGTVNNPQRIIEVLRDPKHPDYNCIGTLASAAICLARYMHNDVKKGDDSCPCHSGPKEVHREIRFVDIRQSPELMMNLRESKRLLDLFAEKHAPSLATPDDFLKALRSEEDPDLRKKTEIISQTCVATVIILLMVMAGGDVSDAKTFKLS